MLSESANYDEAEQALQMALCHCSEAKRHLASGLMGFLYKNRGDYDQAAKWFRAVIDAKPDDADGYIWLGSVLARKGELIEAEQVHRKATTCKDGRIDEAYLNLGLVLRGQGKLEEARQYFEKAIAIDPHYKAAKHALADVNAAIGYRSKDPQ
jgi:tetratricopeptide (TPR) repeat protein